MLANRMLHETYVSEESFDLFHEMGASSGSHQGHQEDSTGYPQSTFYHLKRSETLNQTTI